MMTEMSFYNSKTKFILLHKTVNMICRLQQWWTCKKRGNEL